MDIFFRTKKGIIRMRDKIEVENRSNKSYITTSSLNGQEKVVLGEYETQEKALEALDKIDELIDKMIKSDKNVISIEMSKEREENE